MPRTYVRKFDYDEAARLREQGLSWGKIAQHFGVSAGAVRRAVLPGERERLDRVSRAWIYNARCPECGAQTTRLKLGGDRLCRECSAQAQSTSATEDLLRCSDCGEWKPDEDFGAVTHGSKFARRGRRYQCRQCDTKRRQDYRVRNYAREQAYWHEYDQRRRKTA